MKTANVMTLASYLLIFGCAADKNLSHANDENEAAVNVDLTSSQLNDFKVSYAGGDDASQLEKRGAKGIDDSVQLAGAIARKDSPVTDVPPASSQALPFNGDAGKCYAKVKIPATFENKQVEYIKEEASYRIEVFEPEFVLEKRKIKIKDASEKIEVIPAEYKWIEDQIRVDDVGNHINKTVRKKVMVEPPKTVKHRIPAEYRLVEIKKLIKPARINRVAIPSTRDSVVLAVETSKAYDDWKPVLCATQITSDLVYKLQNALRKSKHYSGDVDGIFGSRTLQAVQRFQEDNHIAAGQITIETLEKLGVDY